MLPQGDATGKDSSTQFDGSLSPHNTGKKNSSLLVISLRASSPLATWARALTAVGCLTRCQLIQESTNLWCIRMSGPAESRAHQHVHCRTGLFPSRPPQSWYATSLSLCTRDSDERRVSCLSKGVNVHLRYVSNKASYPSLNYLHGTNCSLTSLC